MIAEDINVNVLSLCLVLSLTTEDEAFNMVKKIHRKLPAGGILIFLTGKGEIIRMVKRLRRCLDRKGTADDRDRGWSGIEDVTSRNAEEESQAPRDLDDDEADADIFTEHDDFDELTVDKDKDDYPSKEEASQRSHVLPL